MAKAIKSPVQKKASNKANPKTIKLKKAVPQKKANKNLHAKKTKPAKNESHPLDISQLSKKEVINSAKKFSKKYCVGNGRNFRLKDYDTKASFELGEEEKPLVKETLQLGIEALAAMQDILYAQDRWSLLLIFQAMDAAGKDGAIKHVMSGINPQGCQVASFKVPSVEELDHDYIWRCQKHLPERGRIGIFNRSYYEEVLVVRVHEEILKNQRLPEKLITKNIWQDRFKDISNFEKYLRRNGTIVIKFFLHVSKDEQKKRFIERIDNPDKNWKFSTSDAKERGFWKEYMLAYEDMIKNTSTEKSPWYVIPADNKSYARIAISSAIIQALDEMGLEYPKVSKEKMAELQVVKKALLAEK
jgi:PPK2 family polyphosphate:nucleotide phosphotransferase